MAALHAAKDEEELLEEAYMRRLGMAADFENRAGLEPSLDLLEQLVYAHVTRIPYENLDIHTPPPPPPQSWPAGAEAEAGGGGGGGGTGWPRPGRPRPPSTL